MLVIHQMLEERAAKALHDRADGLAVQRQRVDDAADILDADIVEQLHMPGLRIDRDMSRMRAVTVGALVARVGALRGNGLRGQRGQRHRSAFGTDNVIAIDPDVVGRAAQMLRGCGMDRALQIRGRCYDRRSTHDGGARAERAEAFADMGRGAMEDTANAIERHFQRVGRDLGEDGLEPLPHRRRADIDRYRPIAFQHHAGVLARARSTAFEIAAHRGPAITAVDQLALQRALTIPIDFGEAAVQRLAVVTGIGRSLHVQRHDRGQRIGHVDFRDKIAPAELDSVDA